MSRQVQELIDKIKSEGIEAARKRARDIELEAQKKAGQIIDEAKHQAERIVRDAKQDAERTHAATQTVLKQASRDMILSLKKEIQNILQNIIRSEVKASLTPAQLAAMIEAAIKNCVHSDIGKGDIVVNLSPADLEKIKKEFIGKLQGKVKEAVTFKPTDGISKGFTISFDKGKSSFDFSQESLAEYLAAFLNQEIANLVKDTASA